MFKVVIVEGATPSQLSTKINQIIDKTTMLVDVDVKVTSYKNEEKEDCILYTGIIKIKEE